MTSRAGGQKMWGSVSGPRAAGQEREALMESAQDRERPPTVSVGPDGTGVDDGTELASLGNDVEGSRPPRSPGKWSPKARSRKTKDNF